MKLWAYELRIPCTDFEHLGLLHNRAKRAMMPYAVGANFKAVYNAGPALDIQHSPVRVYLAHAGQPGQAGSDHPAKKKKKSLLKTCNCVKSYSQSYAFDCLPHRLSMS